MAFRGWPASRLLIELPPRAACRAPPAKGHTRRRVSCIAHVTLSRAHSTHGEFRKYIWLTIRSGHALLGRRRRARLRVVKQPGAQDVEAVTASQPIHPLGHTVHRLRTSVGNWLLPVSKHRVGPRVNRPGDGPERLLQPKRYRVGPLRETPSRLPVDVPHLHGHCTLSLSGSCRKYGVKSCWRGVGSRSNMARFSIFVIVQR